MQKLRPKQRLVRLIDPGEREDERCAPGSIEQQLDMCEDGSLKGDSIEHHAEGPTPDEPSSEDPMAVDEEFGHFDPDMSERDREGDEMSGDEHSSGLQGGEPEEVGLAGEQKETQQKARVIRLSRREIISRRAK